MHADMSEIKIGPTLKSLMKKKGLTLKELQAATGVPASTIAEWTANRNPKNATQVKKVSEFLGVSMHFLLFGEGDANETMQLQSILKQDIFSGVFEINIKRVKIPKD